MRKKNILIGVLVLVIIVMGVMLAMNYKSGGVAFDPITGEAKLVRTPSKYTDRPCGREYRAFIVAWETSDDDNAWQDALNVLTECQGY